MLDLCCTIVVCLYLCCLYLCCFLYLYCLSVLLMFVYTFVVSSLYVVVMLSPILYYILDNIISRTEYFMTSLSMFYHELIQKLPATKYLNAIMIWTNAYRYTYKCSNMKLIFLIGILKLITVNTIKNCETVGTIFNYKICLLNIHAFFNLFWLF